MQTDKNTIIGFVLLGLVFMGYFWYTEKQQQTQLVQEKYITDSIAVVNAIKANQDTATTRIDSLRKDTIAKAAIAGDFSNAANGKEELTIVENELIRATFSNKGARLKSVELKKHNSTDGKPVVLGGHPHDNLSYTINTNANQSTQLSNLYFNTAKVQKENDGSSSITFLLAANNGQSVTHRYSIRPNNYMIDWNVDLQGADKLLSKNTLNINWTYITIPQQSSTIYERQQCRIYYVLNGDYDYNSIAGGKKVDFSNPVDWLSNKQQFFNATLVAKNKMQSGNIQVTELPDTTGELFTSVAGMQINIPATSSVTIPLQLYFGPNDYAVLKAYNNQMENIVDLGSGMFSFVKYINRWIIIPVFDFFAGFISNFGWVIALLTLFIRVVTSPLTYSSYLSGAKMKALRPELDTLKKKFGDDQQGYAVEQMKLFREAGVNPLGGCIPALLQIPIFFSLYSFFNSCLAVRGESFLWAKDLSTYDVIYQLPFSIPLGFGDHISLFTLLAVITSFLISIYNMAMTPNSDNPAMKYMPYIFPFMLLFIFNRLPSALTWYYTVSNIVTLGLQFVIQNYIINHDKILAKIAETRKKPKTKSKFQERYTQMMETQKKVQDLKKKPQK